MGPMAQDVFAAFGLGDSDLRIATIDLDGVALAAIKGLHVITKEQEQRIAALEAGPGSPATGDVATVASASSATTGAQPVPAPQFTVIRESYGPSDGALWGVAGAIALFGCGLFAVAFRRKSERHA